MKIQRILTNNAVVIIDVNGREQIICGKGIAYKKRPGDYVDKQLVNQVFSLPNQDMNMKFQQLLLEIPLEELQTADEIIKHAKLKIGKQVNDSIYISLSDHIHMSIARAKEGIQVKNALLWDIKQFYPDEFAIGLDALAMIQEKLHMQLSEDEAGFIALHIVNATLEDNQQDIYQITQVMQEVGNIIKYYFNLEFDTSSVYYYRFITHLKFFAQRLITKRTFDNQKSDDLFEVVKQKYPKQSDCVERIAGFIKKNYHYEVSKEEKLYLTIHITRITEI